MCENFTTLCAQDTPHVSWRVKLRAQRGGMDMVQDTQGKVEPPTGQPNPRPPHTRALAKNNSHRHRNSSSPLGSESVIYRNSADSVRLEYTTSPLYTTRGCMAASMSARSPSYTDAVKTTRPSRQIPSPSTGLIDSQPGAHKSYDTTPSPSPSRGPH